MNSLNSLFPKQKCVTLWLSHGDTHRRGNRSRQVKCHPDTAKWLIWTMSYFQLVLIKNTKSMHSIQLLFGYLFIFNVLFFIFDSIFFIFDFLVIFFIFDSIFFIFDIIFFFFIFDFLFFLIFDVLFFFIFYVLFFAVFNSLFLIFNVQWNLIMD